MDVCCGQGMFSLPYVSKIPARLAGARRSIAPMQGEMPPRRRMG